MMVMCGRSSKLDLLLNPPAPCLKSRMTLSREREVRRQSVLLKVKAISSLCYWFESVVGTAIQTHSPLDFHSFSDRDGNVVDLNILQAAKKWLPDRALKGLQIGWKRKMRGIQWIIHAIKWMHPISKIVRLELKGPRVSADPVISSI